MLDITPAEIEKLQARIVVIGAGGAGCNAINNMIEKRLPGVQFAAMNTDTQSLGQSMAENKIQLGLDTTEGLGAGSNPDVGRAAALESEQKIQTILKNAHMVFITAGMGGGTGTGSAPVIARLAKEMGILTVGVVTKPFRFERKRRAEIADAGISELQQFVDTLIVIPNENLFRLSDGPTTLNDAFSYADDVLLSGVRGVTDLIVKEGKINLDFNDIKTVMKEKGKAVMGTGEASGENRAQVAATQAINNPLLEDISLRGASSVLINITSGNDVTLRETDDAVNCVNEEVSEDALVIFGLTMDEDLGDNLRVSVIATGVDSEMDETNTGIFRTPEPASERPAVPVVEQARVVQPAVAPTVHPEPVTSQPEPVQSKTDDTGLKSFPSESFSSEDISPSVPERGIEDEGLFAARPSARAEEQSEVSEPTLELDVASKPEASHISAAPAMSPLSELRRRSHQAPQRQTQQETPKPAESSNLPNFLRRGR